MAPVSGGGQRARAMGNRLGRLGPRAAGSGGGRPAQQETGRATGCEALYVAGTVLMRDATMTSFG